MLSNVKKFIKKNKEFSLILAVALIARLVFLFATNELWWDSAVYIGMGKHIFSLGKLGLWEHIRPFFVPFFLGIFWKLNLDVILAGKILELIFSAGSIVLLYLIAKNIFNKRTALIAASIFSFSSALFLMNFQLYTEIPAVFLILSGLYSYLKEKHLLAGLFLGFAFIAKFPAGIFFAILLVVILFSKNIKKISIFCAGFALVAVSFFIINQIAYGSFLLPLIDAKKAIADVLGCNFLWHKPWHWYFSFILLKENFLHIFSLVGIYYFLKKPNTKKTIVFLFLVLPFVYFLQLHCRDWRYLIVVVPFLVLFVADGINRQIKNKEHFFPIVAIVLVLSAALSLGFYHENTVQPSQEQQQYVEFIKNNEIKGEIWSSNPAIVVYSDEKIHKIYYPVFNSEKGWMFYQYLKNNSGKIEYVFLDRCGGGIICHPDDDECAKNLDYIYSNLNNNFDIVYDKTRGICNYRIYRNKLYKLL